MPLDPSSISIKSPITTFLLAALFLTMFIPCSGQDLKDWVRFGQEALEEGDPHEAVGYFSNAYELASDNATIAYLYAEALRQDHQYEKALQAYQEVSRKDDGEKFPKALFHIAEIQKFLGDHRRSKRSWEALKERYKNDTSSYYYQKARQEVRSCEFAIGMLRDSAAFGTTSHLKGPNTPESEFAPYQYSDSVLFFSSLRTEHDTAGMKVDTTGDYDTRIFRSKRKQKTWSKGTPLDSLINQKGTNNANTTFSKNGERMYFSRCPTSDSCKIHLIRKENGNWTTPEALDTLINEPGASSTHPMISRIGEKEYLFFSSNRDSGAGKFDIWYGLLNEQGNPVHVKNAGQVVNSPGNEITPYYDTSSHSLFFSSDWHRGLGGFDIHRGIGSPGTLDSVVNMGHPLNTPRNDLYFSLTPEPRKALFVSDREGSLKKQEWTCCNDIYAFQFPIPKKEEEKDTVIPPPTLTNIEEHLPVTLYFHNDEPDPDSWDTTTQRSYSELYNSYRERIPEYKANAPKDVQEQNQDTIGKRINKFFEKEVTQGKEDLEELAELLSEALEKGHRFILKVQGHASPLAKTDYNVNLSKRRINSLTNYLYEYADGALIPYLEDTAENGGSVTLVQEPYGEYLADSTVSDDPQAKDRSIYSLEAARERKVRVIDLERISKDTGNGTLVIDDPLKNLGTIPKGQPVEITFRYKNKGDHPVRVKDLEPGKGIQVLHYPKKEIAPQDTGSIRLSLNPMNRKGSKVIESHIRTNGTPERITLTITTVVE